MVFTGRGGGGGGIRRNTGRKVMRGAEDSSRKRKDIQDQSRPSDKPIIDESAADIDDDDNENDGIDAYKALLTLFKSDEPQNKKRRTGLKRNESVNIYSKTRKVEKESDNEDAAEDDIDNVEGFDGNISDDIESGTEIEDDEDDLDDAEESGEIQISDDDNEGDIRDPFEWHFSAPDPVTISKAVAAASSASGWKKPTKYKKTTSLGDRSMITLPNVEEPSILTSENPLTVKSLKSLKIKYRLEAPFQRVNPTLSRLQADIAGPMFAYQDILFPSRSLENEVELQNLYAAHAVNHIYKTRDRILKNNSKLASASEDHNLELRDQGFTRPKVLVLLPTRNAAYEFVNKVAEISGLNQSENRKRFKEAFYDDAVPPETKPDDFRRIFAGNSNDLFCLGVKFTRQALKLYSSFYSSDLIIASPLGLRLIIGNKEDEKRKKRDYDFLSSIEITIVDQADVLQMQTWENVSHIFKHMNLIPRESHGCDFSRVRNWYLEENSKYLRQTIILSQYATPEMNSCISKQCYNISGKLRIRPTYTGSMATIGMRIRQTFTRIYVPEHTQDPDLRFKHFTSVVLPAVQRGSSYEGTLIFTPSYMDFVRLRNYMDDNNQSCNCISEYSPVSEVARSRSFFATGRTKMMLYTERLHHFRRYEIKGVRQVIMYGVPENPKFYQEIVRNLVRTVVEANVDPEMLRVRIIYSKWDSAKLERIVGTNRVGPLIQGNGDAYEFH
ncbi:Utp25p [Sugiyamaella lignohabitans]|uniref:U3 small nucleolar RNA-associated protein 25 n=1 Tax=Sugiyamaella lignohabitans TaxID=796027 RepID=A0A167FAZ4_9ASCO|nr:Utp25p [Sugiyamaella lignohabitans]ANB15052.1 Utp25p [Sugiyamaella lignohabitans]